MIHSTAIVSDRAQLGVAVEVGPYSIIHDNVVLCNGCKVGAFCELGLPTPLAVTQLLEIGANANIRSHTVLYQGSKIGHSFTTGHYVTVRENSVIGEGVQIGSRGDIQGDCEIGNYVKMHSDVHVGKLSSIGNFVRLYPGVLLTNDPTPPSEELAGVRIFDFVVVSSNVLVLPGSRLEEDSVIGAGSVVKGAIRKGFFATGNPAKMVCPAVLLRHHSNPQVRAYPWRNRFKSGYPANVSAEWGFGNDGENQ